MPEGDGWLYEPKWDGFRCIVFRDGDDVELGSRNERPLTRYFPEIIEPLKAQLPERCVVDGEIVVPLSERRAVLLGLLPHAEPPLYLTPASEDPAVAEGWFHRFEGGGLDGIVAKRLDGTYTPDKRTMIKVKHERTADCAVAGYRVHKDGAGVCTTWASRPASR